MNAVALPSIRDAKLPASYEAARNALANCERIDECQQWADKAEALASYAKQADDQSLRKLADRIQARAISRMGELLKTFQNPGARTDLPSGDAPTKMTQRQAAANAGVSKDQEVTAIRVANVPRDVFERLVESDEPPTVTALAEMGKRPLLDLGRAKPHDFSRATHALASLRRFAEFTEENDPREVASGVLPAEVETARRHVAVIDSWLDVFITSLED